MHRFKINVGEMNEDTILDLDLEHQMGRRRALLPTWIKIFVWIFMLFGLVVPIAFLFGLLGYEFTLSLYGLETMQALSIKGIIILALFAIKGVVSFGLWMEKDWGVQLALVDAIIGIIVCGFVMCVLPFLIESDHRMINIRLELVVLIPYLIKMIKIKDEWALEN